MKTTLSICSVLLVWVQFSCAMRSRKYATTAEDLRNLHDDEHETVLIFSSSACPTIPNSNYIDEAVAQMGDSVNFVSIDTESNKDTELLELYHQPKCNTVMWIAKENDLEKPEDTQLMQTNEQFKEWVFNSHGAVKLPILNECPYTIVINWVNQKGSERTIDKVDPGSHKSLNTVLGSTFVARKLSDDEYGPQNEVVAVLPSVTTGTGVWEISTAASMPFDTCAGEETATAANGTATGTCGGGDSSSTDSPSAHAGPYVVPTFHKGPDLHPLAGVPYDEYFEPVELPTAATKSSAKGSKGAREITALRHHSESRRMQLNRDQVAKVPTFTPVGFEKMKLPPNVYDLLRRRFDELKPKDFDAFGAKYAPTSSTSSSSTPPPPPPPPATSSSNEQQPSSSSNASLSPTAAPISERLIERWPTDNTYVNHWEVPTLLMEISWQDKDYIFNALRPIMEAWSGAERLQGTSLYGLRSYHGGSVLMNHVDRVQTHVISGIMNVAQKVGRPWPLEIYDHDGRAHFITMEPGELVLYESASCIHGRPTPLNGTYYVNAFVHFKPAEGWDFGFM